MKINRRIFGRLLGISPVAAIMACARKAPPKTPPPPPAKPKAAVRVEKYGQNVRVHISGTINASELAEIMVRNFREKGITL